MINANAIAIAGGAIAASLVDVLTEKGLLTEDEAASVRAKALQLLTPYTMTSSDADAACRLITDMLVGKPSARATREKLSRSVRGIGCTEAQRRSPGE